MITSETGGNTVSTGGEVRQGTSDVRVQSKTTVNGVVVEDINQSYATTSPINIEKTYYQNIGTGTSGGTVQTNIKIQTGKGQSSLVKNFNIQKAATTTATTSLAQPVLNTQGGHVATSRFTLLAQGGLQARNLLQQFITYVFSIFHF